MTLNIATMTSLCVLMPEGTCVGVALTPEIEAAVLDPAGDNRIFCANDARGSPLTQLRFSHHVASIWPRLDQTWRGILAARSLNPRASIANDQLRSALGPVNSEELTRLEGDANRALLVHLGSASVNARLESVDLQHPKRHYYFIPSPQVTRTPFVDVTGRVLSRHALMDCIVSGLLCRGLISETETITALNTYVSEFPLLAGELARLLGTSWTQGVLDAALAQFLTAMKEAGFRTALPSLSVSEFVGAMQEIGVYYGDGDRVGESAQGVFTEASMIELVATFNAEGLYEAQGGGEDSSGGVDDEGNYLGIYQKRFRALPMEERIALARSDDTVALYALCHDPNPQVITAVIGNPHSNLELARLAANHHHTPQGLEALLRCPGFIRDAGVRQFLLRNSALQEAQLRRLLQAFQLGQLYRTAIGHEILEPFKRITVEVFRNRYQHAEAQEKVGLIMRTGGRCLDLLRNRPLDAAVIRLLLQRDKFTRELVQRLGDYPGVTPELRRHMHTCLAKRS